MRRSFMAFCIVFVLASYGSAARGDDAQTLLAKNKEFAGWVFGDPSMNGLRLTGISGDQSLVDLRRGAIWRRTWTNPKTNVANADGYTGQRYWLTTSNGFVVPVIGDGAKYKVAYQMVMNQAIPALPGTLHGSATVDGTPTQIVRVNAQNADVIDAYIDPKTGKLMRAVIDPDGSAFTIDILDYMDVAGKKIVSKWRIGKSTVELTKAERVEIPDADFHPPSASATWSFGPPAPVPITFGHRRILIRAKVNGAEGNFILDSGAGGIALNPDFARRANLKALAHRTGYGLNGEIAESIDRADTIEFGPNVLHNVFVTEGVNVHGAHEDADGLFGFDFLAAAIVDIDLVKEQMTIYDPSKFAVTAQGPQVIVDLSRGVPAIPVTFNRRVKAHLIFDTGDPMAVFASEKLYGSRGVEMRLEGHVRMGGAGGDSDKIASCGHTASMEIGPITYENVPTCFGPAPELFGKDGGIIGLDFLKHFNLTFDYPESSLYLTPTGK